MKTDLHIHSCLSPCGSDDMYPFDLVGMAKVMGLDLIALTDHNSAKNCPAAEKAAREYGIGFLPGVEINTAEEVHCVCLFPDVSSAMSFDEMLYGHIPDIKNREAVFGRQIIVAPDGTEKTEPRLLITATDISIMELPKIVRRYGGLMYPAHVDRDANGLFMMLGAWPRDLDVCAAEYVRSDEGVPDGIVRVQASDAHYFENMSEGFELPLSSADFRGLAEYLTGGGVQK